VFLTKYYSGEHIKKNEMVRARRGRGKVHRVLVGKPEGKSPLGRPRCSGRIILRWIFRKWDGGAWTGLTETETVGRHLQTH
jgi:hypothetical protein